MEPSRTLMYSDPSTLQVLLIEDRPQDAERIQKLLEEASDLPCEVCCVPGGRLQEEALEGRPVDIVLLDLDLAGGEGLAALRALRTRSPNMPTIVLTGTLQQPDEHQELAGGAEEVLVKNEIDGQRLERCLNHALGRRRAGDETSIRDAHSPLFARQVERYVHMLDLALTSDPHGPSDVITEDLRLFAEQLGALIAGPRDLIDVHLAALERKILEVPPEQTQAVVEESRFLLLELMGHLLSLYRMQTISL